MGNRRLIVRLDIKGPNLVKGIHLEGLRVVGDPAEHAVRYEAQGADELVYMDIVASLYGRNNLSAIVERTAQDIFIPLTVGGGVRSLDDITRLLRAGADKVAINTAAIHRPEFLKEAARTFGSQCVVLSIEAKRTPSGWEAYTDNGREKSGVDALSWARRAVDLGAGEILLTSVDQEGTRRGYDLELTRLVSESVPVPVIACGGAGTLGHLVEAATVGKADALCAASLFHYKTHTVTEAKLHLLEHGVGVRRPT